MNLRMFSFNTETCLMDLNPDFSIFTDDIELIELHADTGTPRIAEHNRTEVKAYYERINQMCIKRHNTKWMYDGGQ